jgi:CBS domain-containing protein
MAIVTIVQRMSIADVMSPRVVSVRPDETVQVAIARMLEQDVGSVAVCEQERLVGIFTEADGGSDFGELKVRDVMTRSLVTVSPDVGVAAAARLMGERRIRHLPVLYGGHLLGVVGIREVLRSLVEQLWREHDPEARETARGLLTSDRPHSG